jgi:nucleotide-binding universal stress UspA family protein
MKEIKKIVVAVDLGAHTEKIVDYAIFVASLFSARLSFFHVAQLYETYAELELVAFPSVQRAEKDLFDHAEKKMARLVADCERKCPGCSGKVGKGDVVSEIIAHAEQEKAGLIIIGTHGAKGLDQILLGTVTRRVGQRAPCPVLTLNPYKYPFLH